MMTREEFSRQATAAMKQEMDKVLLGFRERLRKEYAAKRGKMDLIGLLKPRN